MYTMKRKMNNKKQKTKQTKKKKINDQRLMKIKTNSLYDIQLEGALVSSIKPLLLSITLRPFHNINVIDVANVNKDI